MGEFFNRLFSTALYVSPAQRERARLIYSMTLLCLALYTIFVFFIPTRSSGNVPFARAAFSDPRIAFYLITFYAVGIGTIVLVRKGRLDIAGFGPIVMLFTSVAPIGLFSGYVYADQTIPLVLIIVLGALLNHERGLFVATAIALIMYYVGLELRPSLPSAAGLQDNNDFFTVSLELLSASGITYLFLRSTRHSTMDIFAQGTEDRLKLAEITTETARLVSSRVPLDDVLDNAVEQIIASYPRIYHAQIFLLDDVRKNAQLVASTGPSGKLLLQRKHSLEVGSKSVIGRVTSDGEAIVARAGSADSVHRRNEVLPETQVEAAFPLRIGEMIIGALDMQSTIDTTFQAEEIPIYQALADSIAVAIDNARLFEETERQLADNQKLIDQSREAVQEIERLNRQLTVRAWENYLEGKDKTVGLAVDFQTKQATHGAQRTDSLVEATQTNALIHKKATDQQVIAVPLRVRGQVIGAMEFELEPDGTLTPEDLDLVQEVGERFGLAVENLRLFEESQRIAYREAMVNEISTRLQASNNVEAVLAEAARSLSQTLNVGKVAIRLGAPPAANGVHGNGN
jgi:GAF domain-containing protein